MNWKGSARQSLSKPEEQLFSPWTERTAPHRFLIIRMHALGDVAVTLPAITALRERFPTAQIDYLTMPDAAPLPQSAQLFDHVFELPTYRRAAGWIKNLMREGFRLRRRQYDVVLDLQRNWISRVLRRLAFPRAWGEFDRFAPRSAGERVMEVLDKSGFHGLTPRYHVAVPPPQKAKAAALLRQHGWDMRSRLVILNPAGLWPTRHWPIENFAALTDLWRGHEAVQFLLLGTERMRDRATILDSRLGDSAVNVVGSTSLQMAMAILQHVSLIVTEDSGLMHMAWCSGVPVVALFGSSRHLWSSPPGPHVRVLHSGDLLCGQCMSPTCAYHDVHCLTRFSPDMVFGLSQELLLAGTTTGAPS